MFAEVHERGDWETAVVEGAGHYVAEENPDGFVEAGLGFVGRHNKGAGGD